jgi:hypothetical protein
VGALIDGVTIDCVVCNDKFPYEYKHCLNVIIQTIDKSIVQCTIRAPILQDVLPALTQLAYEAYIEKKTVAMYMLRDFGLLRGGVNQ